jgi:hypothetical protein
MCRDRRTDIFQIPPYASFDSGPRPVAEPFCPMTSANDNNDLPRRRIVQTGGRRAHKAEERITAILYALRTRDLPLLAWADDPARGELRSIRRCVSGHGSRRHFVSIWSGFPLVVIAGGIGDRSRTATLAREMECRSGTGWAWRSSILGVQPHRQSGCLNEESGAFDTVCRANRTIRCAAS